MVRWAPWGRRSPCRIVDSDAARRTTSNPVPGSIVRLWECTTTPRRRLRRWSRVHRHPDSIWTFRGHIEVEVEGTVIVGTDMVVGRRSGRPSRDIRRRGRGRDIPIGRRSFRCRLDLLDISHEHQKGPASVFAALHRKNLSSWISIHELPAWSLQHVSPYLPSRSFVLSSPFPLAFLVSCLMISPIRLPSPSSDTVTPSPSFPISPSHTPPSHLASTHPPVPRHSLFSHLTLFMALVSFSLSSSFRSGRWTIHTSMDYFLPSYHHHAAVLGISSRTLASCPPASHCIASFRSVPFVVLTL